MSLIERLFTKEITTKIERLGGIDKVELSAQQTIIVTFRDSDRYILEVYKKSETEVVVKLTHFDEYEDIKWIDKEIVSVETEQDFNTVLQSIANTQLYKVRKRPVGHVEIIEDLKYITGEEFDRILNEIRTNYTIREEIIVELMFSYGLRLSEILGVTSDDVFNEERGDFEYVPTFYIRNRLSDQKYQCVHTCMEVHDIKDYQSEKYQTENKGYQKVDIEEYMLKAINEYIEEEHMKAINNYNENYFKFTIADRVKETTCYDLLDYNYYIFIDDEGKPLTDTEWNNILRNIFKACNIEIEYDGIEYNLNQRLRHRFALYNVRCKHCSKLALMNKMRCYDSTIEDYFKPTRDEYLQKQIAVLKSYPWFNEGVE